MINKNKKKERARQNRVWFDMPLDTQTHKSAKHPDRNARKKEFKKMLDE